MDLFLNRKLFISWAKKIRFPSFFFPSRFKKNHCISTPLQKPIAENHEFTEMNSLTTKIENHWYPLFLVANLYPIWNGEFKKNTSSGGPILINTILKWMLTPPSSQPRDYVSLQKTTEGQRFPWPDKIVRRVRVDSSLYIKVTLGRIGWSSKRVHIETHQ